jgi:hypothetical protein
VRVLDAIEKNEQLIVGWSRRATFGIISRWAGKKVFDIEGFARGGESDNALVMFSGCGAVELGAIFEAYGHAARAREVKNFLYAPAVLPASDEYAVERLPGNERFFDSMKSRQVVH